MQRTLDATTGTEDDPLQILPDPPSSGESRLDRQFFRWSVGCYLVVTGVIVALTMHRLGGRWVYVLDDPAIHLSVAQNLLHHGTWGVEAGHYQSASSSPMWTVVLAVLLAPFGRIREALPLLCNLVVGVALLKVLSKLAPPFRPSWKHPIQVLGVLFLVTFVLFLPGLAVVGMEHTLHAFLVLATVVLFGRRRRGERWGPRWLPYLLLGLAVLTRFETVFVAAGLGVGVLAGMGGQYAVEGDPDVSPRRRITTVALIGVSSGVPLGAYALVNHAMGQGLLPNSVLYKSQVTGADGASTSLEAIIGRFFQDPLLPVLWLAAMLYLLLCEKDRNASVLSASVLAIAIPLHVTLAKVGWYERYQSYLVILGVAFLFAVARERLPASARAVRQAHRPAAISLAVLLVAVPFVHYKINWTFNSPASSVDMYRQHYLAGEFLARYYDGKPVATGELGYISLFHDGPVTDLYGLGDYQVLRYRQEKRDPRVYLPALARERGFNVAAVYPVTMGYLVPPNWILVGTWVTPEGHLFTSIDRRFQFWATTPDEVAPLRAHLQEFAKELPPGEHLELDGLAEYRAAVQIDKRSKP